MDASFLPRDLRATLLRTLGKKYRILVEMENGNRDDGIKADHNDRKNVPIVKYNEGSFDDFKAVLEDILKKNHMEQFVVAENTEKHNTYSVLKRGDLEQFGLVICGHCGMVFGNCSEKMAHEKIHYFI
ncbi:MAG: hypothetical protein M3156_02995 [Thermoproteota archaeon]|nr:hypothetical protein [Thermoproteota archaeon]